MRSVERDKLDQDVEENYLNSVRQANPEVKPVLRIDRFTFLSGQNQLLQLCKRRVSKI